jgi:hypothetical protein
MTLADQDIPSYYNSFRIGFSAQSLLSKKRRSWKTFPSLQPVSIQLGHINNGDACIWELYGSNLSIEILTEVFHGLPQSLQANIRIIP